MLASFNAGRSDVTITWAERAIAQGVAENRLYQVHRLAGVACSNQGRLDERSITTSTRMSSPSGRGIPGKSWIVSRLWRTCIACAASWTVPQLSA